MNVLLNHEYDPLKAGKKKISGDDTSPLWITNTLDQTSKITLSIYMNLMVLLILVFTH